MLTDTQKTQIRNGLQKITEGIPGFRSRSGQKQMIAEVARTFARYPDPPGPLSLLTGQPPRPEPGSTIACIQGGTGVGKSLGYLLPSAILAKAKNKKLIIATATVALQEQLTQKDLPGFLAAAGLQSTVVLAKGRARYLCLHRAQASIDDLRRPGRVAQFDLEFRPLSQPVAGDSNESLLAALDSMVQDFNAGRWNGDRDSRHGITDKAWSSATVERHGCLGSHCGYAAKCAQIEARKRVRGADIIVANHDLVLADLAMGGGTVLPPPEECFYIFDEAHHLPEKAISSFASNHLLGHGRQMAERIGSFSSSLARAIGPAFSPSAGEITSGAGRLAESLEEAHAFFASLAALTPTQDKPNPIMDFQQSCLPDGFFSLGENILSAAGVISRHIDDAIHRMAALGESDSTRKPLYDKLHAEASIYAGRIDEIRQTWQLLLEEPPADQPPVAKWVETSSGHGAIDFRISASSVRAGTYLRQSLWNRAAGAVLTSATLKTTGSFEPFLRDAGLLELPGVTCLDVPSPFDYYQQGTLEIPRMKSLPANVAGHTTEVAERVTALFDSLDGGMMVLFASKKQMNEVAALLPASVRERTLIQGSDTRSTLVAEHKRRVDAGERSLLIGLESFSEGVDLAGRYCTRVVIAKLPFAVPDDPVIKTLSDWIESRGGRSFNEVLVPAAARKLEQRVGRLIRTESDRGEVIVMDTRLWDTAYGKQMLRGLPPFRLIVKGNEVRL